MKKKLAIAASAVLAVVLLSGFRGGGWSRDPERIKQLTGSRSPVEFRPLPEDDPKVRQPDIGRARALLGWEPVVGLDEGLRHTIDYFRDKV